MRVLLADPPRRGSYYHAFFPNLGLLYLVSSLRERFGPDIRVKGPPGPGLRRAGACWDDKFIPGLKRIADAIHTERAVRGSS